MPSTLREMYNRIRAVFRTVRLLCFILLTPLGIALAENGALSHEALFAPNKEFPYFERASTLDDSSPCTFSSSNAAMLAQCSMLIYVKETDFIQKALREAGFEVIEFFDTNSTFAFLASNDENIVIAFRGTETGDTADYLTDIKVVHKKFSPEGSAHAGFIDALDQVSAPLALKVSELNAQSPRKTVWVTGHSLGGALAILFSIRYSDTVDAVYTIGSPRVASRKLARHWSNSLPVFRIVNNNDFVARVPGGYHYEHIGPTYFIKSNGELVIDPPFSQIWRDRLKGHNEFTTRLIKEHWSQNDFDTIASDYFVDHSPRLYVEALLRIQSDSSAISTP